MPRPEESKLAAAWRAVWAKVPERDRRRIAYHCLPRTGHAYPTLAYQLGGLGPALAVCTDQGTRLVFDAYAVLSLPTPGLEELLAHELAHAVLAARGVPDWADDEAGVRRLARGWGFGTAGVRAWYSDVSGG